MIKILVLLTFATCLCNATINCNDEQKTQLASFHQRLNHMLSTLYSSPLFSKLEEKSTTPKPEEPANETPCQSQPPTPPVIYIAQAPTSPPIPAPTPSYTPGPQPSPPMPTYAYPPLLQQYPQTWNYDQYYQHYYNPPSYPYPYPAPYDASYPYPNEYYRPPYPQPQPQPQAQPCPCAQSPTPYPPQAYPRPYGIPPPPQYS